MATSHDTSYQTGLYIKQGGQELHVGNPVPGPDGKGAAIVVGANSQQCPLQVVFSYTKGAANVVNVTAQVQDLFGNNIADVFNFDLWLSGAASGAGLGAVPSTGLAATTGTILSGAANARYYRVQTDATGKFVGTLTDTGLTLYFPAAQAGLQNTNVGAQLAAGNYGP